MIDFHNIRIIARLQPKSHGSPTSARTSRNKLSNHTNIHLNVCINLNIICSTSSITIKNQID